MYEMFQTYDTPMILAHRVASRLVEECLSEGTTTTTSSGHGELEFGDD